MTMNGDSDLISELLRPVRLTGVFQSSWQARAPWAVTGGTSEQCAVLHYVCEGSCWITSRDRDVDPIRLSAGDVAMFLPSAPHQLSDEPGRQAVPLQGVLPSRDAGTSHTVELGGTGPVTRMLCAGLHFDPQPSSALYQVLPWVLVLDAARVDREPLLRQTLELLAGPGQEHAPGAELVTLRAFELALVLTLRPMLRELSESPHALKAVRHPGISRALVIIYTRYQEPWTIDTLAREAGMSRSAFTSVFGDLVGEGPARHLAGRRMAEAARLLTETRIPQNAIAERVGYQSAVGFHLAFRRWLGITPGAYRQNAWAVAGS
ncbi:AraC family transcriptional regulator [Saccharothrix sp. CB00851]|nr:AraC family transcriptional regulator [Saccharothrix sp. CB00851]